MFGVVQHLQNHPRELVCHWRNNEIDLNLWMRSWDPDRTRRHSPSPSVLSGFRLHTMSLMSGLTWKVLLSGRWDFFWKKTVRTVPVSRLWWMRGLASVQSSILEAGTGPAASSAQPLNLAAHILSA